MQKLFLFLLFFPFSLFAQTNFGGKWEGVLTQKTGGLSSNYYFALDFRQVGDSIWGTSSIAIEGTPNKGTIRLVGKVLGKNTLFFKEIEIVKEKMVVQNAFWCIKTYTLQYDPKNQTLSGDWTAGTCPSGTLSVRKVEPKISPQPQKKPVLPKIEKDTLVQKPKPEITQNANPEPLPEGYLSWEEVRKKAAEKAKMTGKKIILENVYFEQGKSLLKPESYRTLNQLATLLKEVPSLKIKVNGHTDNVGQEYLNQRLSSLRALAVMNYLIREGIAEDRLRSEGFGGLKPISPNDSEQNKQKNRRVEFEILD